MTATSWLQPQNYSHLCSRVWTTLADCSSDHVWVKLRTTRPPSGWERNWCLGIVDCHCLSTQIVAALVFAASSLLYTKQKPFNKLQLSYKKTTSVLLDTSATQEALGPSSNTKSSSSCSALDCELAIFHVTFVCNCSAFRDLAPLLVPTQSITVQSIYYWCTTGLDCIWANLGRQYLLWSSLGVCYAKVSMHLHITQHTPFLYTMQPVQMWKEYDFVVLELAVHMATNTSPHAQQQQH